jgi:hypothetical protein
VSPQHNVKFDPHFDTVKQCVSTSLWQEKSGFLSKREKTPNFTLEPPPRKRKVTFADAKDTHNTSDKRRKQKEPNGNASADPEGAPSDSKEQQQQRGQTPLDDDLASSQTLNGSPGLSPNVIEKEELQLNNQRTASTSEESANSTINQSIQPRLLKAMSAEIFGHNDEPKTAEIFYSEMMHPNPDTMYHHQTMKEPDREEFQKAMQKEINDQMQNGTFTIMKRKDVPKGATILPAVWQEMKREQDILS